MRIIWKKLKDFKGNYQISSLGEVILTPKNIIILDNHIINPPKINIPLKNIRGELHVFIDEKFRDVAILVADNFLPAPENSKNCMLCFRDGNKLNPAASNLFYKVINKRKKRVWQFTLDRKKRLNSFPAATNASTLTNTVYSSLNACLNGHVKQAGGYYWSYDETPTTDPSVKNKAPHKKRGIHQRCKTVVQSDKITGRYLNSYPSAKIASERTGVPASNISAACNGKLKSAGNYLWKFDDLM